MRIRFLMLVALVATLWAALHVANRYVPGLRELHTALRERWKATHNA